MGRLFWKFFAFVWLAQLAGIIAVGSLFWLADRRTDAAFNDIAAGPMVEVQVGAAADVLRYTGAGAFRDWSERERGATVFAVDAAGRDVLGRRADPPLSPSILVAHTPGTDRGNACC